MDKITFINVCVAFPNDPLTLVIFAKDYTNFKTPPAELYGDKQICVTGTLAEYKCKPRISVTTPEEII